MDIRDKKEEERPFAYPKPTENDQQLKNQQEYMDQHPNTTETSLNDMPGGDSEAPLTKDRE
jgi:hypothetical protein